MSDTPRTDALMDSIARDGSIPLEEAAKVVEHAMSLERENRELLDALHNIIADSSCSAYIAQLAEEAIAKSTGGCSPTGKAK